MTVYRDSVKLGYAVAVLDALYAAVHADPSDDGPRQVLADALLERGDPRGELIALQLARARGEPTVAARETALLREHASEWAGELARAGTVVFERGFPARLVTTEDPSRLDLPTTLHALKIELERDAAFPDVFRVPPWLTTLELRARWRRVPTLHLSADARLRAAVLDVATVAAGDLDPLAAVRSLRLSVNDLDPRALTAVTELRDLALFHFRGVRDLRHMTRLERLELWSGGVPRLGGPVHTLHCAGTRIGGIVETIPLRIARALIARDDLTALDPFLARYPDLEDLALDAHGAIADIVAAIAARVATTRVRRLAFGGAVTLDRDAAAAPWRVRAGNVHTKDHLAIAAALGIG